MEQFPLVSIVTPAYNQAEYLAETIESVLAQDYPNIEYIVLDDGSTDSTPEVLQRYKNRVRWERHENMGQARTLNKGWSIARGALLGYLSSDDCLSPKAISQLVQKISDEPKASAVYCDFELMDAQSRSFRTIFVEDFKADRLYIDLVCQPGPGALFRREVFDTAGGWAEHLSQVPDFEFWLRAAKFGQFVRVPQVLAQFRVHEGSASFRPISAVRSMEIVEVMSSYWGKQTGQKFRRSMATAHLVAAKSHAQSGRLNAFFTQWRSALRHRPSIILSPHAWRTLLSGLLRRAAYQLNGRAR